VFAIAAHGLAASATDVGHVRAVLAHRFAALARDLALGFIVHGREAAVRALSTGALLVAAVLCLVAVRHGVLSCMKDGIAAKVGARVSPLPPSFSASTIVLRFVRRGGTRGNCLQA
jgi:hypothetical protein